MLSGSDVDETLGRIGVSFFEVRDGHLVNSIKRRDS